MRSSTARGVVREPGVAEGQHAVEHGRPVAADEDRRVRPLRAAWASDQIRSKATYSPCVARLVLRPDRLHRLDALAQSGHPRARVGAVVGHLLAVPARADAELEPPAGEVVELATSLAVMIGSRSMTRQMPLPTRSREVAAAAAVSATNRSYVCAVLARQLGRRPVAASRGSPGCACARRRTAPRGRAPRPAGRARPGRWRRAWGSSATPESMGPEPTAHARRGLAERVPRLGGEPPHEVAGRLLRASGYAWPAHRLSAPASPRARARRAAAP